MYVHYNFKSWKVPSNQAYVQLFHFIVIQLRIYIEFGKSIPSLGIPISQVLYVESNSFFQRLDPRTTTYALFTTNTVSTIMFFHT